MKTIAGTLAAAIAATIIGSAMAEPSMQEFNLQFDQQPLEKALKQLSNRTGLQIGFFPRTPTEESLVVGPLRGRFTPESALKKLLADSGMTFQWINEVTITVTSDAARSARRGARPQIDATKTADTSLEPEQPRARLSYLNDDPRGFGWIYREDEAAQGGGFNAPNALTAEELEEVIVIGTNIRGNSSVASPVEILDRAFIESTGVSTASELMQTVPQNFALANQSAVFTPGATSDGAQGSSINLRGIGEGTTLTLLNGRRLAPGYVGRAVDISALPLAAIERVEILLDGASAIYGSDAVGGVVNFVTRQDYEGAETRVRSGWADGGVNEHSLNQLFGRAWTSGNALVALGYYERDLLRADDREFVPDDSQVGSLLPEDEVYSATFTARQELGRGLSVFADALYTDRDSFNEGGQTTFNVRRVVDNRQLSATGGLTWRMQNDWQLELSGTHARNKLHLDAFDLQGDTIDDSRFTIRTAQVKADGSLFETPGGNVRLAVGADWRSERFESRSVGFAIVEMDIDQIVRSAFIEAQVPLVGAPNARPGVNRLELSLAGRFDEYSNFGSSFDPKFGVMWAPTSGLKLRGSYGTSYKAPDLPDYSLASNSGFGLFGEDPFAAAGFSYRLSLSGVAPETYAAQESTSASFGVEYTPVEGLAVAANYYRIEYENRISEPSPDSSAVLANPDVFGDLIVRAPTVEQVNAAIALANLGFGFFPFDADFNVDPNFDPASVEVLVDLRRRNLSSTEISGFDLSAEYSTALSIGRLGAGLAATHVIERRDRVTARSPSIDTVDTLYNPPDWRLRGSLGWESTQGWAANLFVSHTDAYVDNRTLVPTRVGSYTTVDGRVAYEFAKERQDGFLSGVVVSLGVLNLFDRRPPRVAIISPEVELGFDPTNADPMGRFLSVEITKAW